MWSGVYTVVSGFSSSRWNMEWDFDLLTVWCRCDIEQEVNGLYTYDRKAKVPVAKVKVIMDAAQDYYYQHVQSHAPKGFRKLLHSLHRS